MDQYRRRLSRDYTVTDVIDMMAGLDSNTIEHLMEYAKFLETRHIKTVRIDFPRERKFLRREAKRQDRKEGVLLRLVVQVCKKEAGADS